MSLTAGQYVDTVDQELRNLARKPTVGQLDEFTEACRQGVLDPDVDLAFQRNSIFKSGPYKNADSLQLHQARLARTPEGDFLFRHNGFAAIADKDGFLYVDSVLNHTPNPLEDDTWQDPVEKQHPGYSNMALIKVGRAIVSAANPEQMWEFLGQAHSLETGLFAGVTGGLFRYGWEGMRDIRAEILASTVVSNSLDGINPVDQVAGLADQYQAELALGLVSSPIAVEAIRQRADQYVQAGVNIH